jgi:hypothetical protein
MAQQLDDISKGVASATGSEFIPIPGFPAVGAGGGVSHAYGGQTSVEYGISFPPGTAVNPVSYGFGSKKWEEQAMAGPSFRPGQYEKLS